MREPSSAVNMIDRIIEDSESCDDLGGGDCFNTLDFLRMITTTSPGSR